MRRLRAKGYNLRYYAVIGAGQEGQQLVRDIEQMGWLGLKCAFFADNNPSLIGTELLGIPIYGPVEKLTELVKSGTIDEVYLALSGDEAQKAYPVLKNLQSAGVYLVHAAGGQMFDLSGNPRRFNQPNPLLNGLLAGPKTLVNTLYSGFSEGLLR